eukprot:scaffold34385_cov19-Tisochrysis_lutea.AAC.6
MYEFVALKIWAYGIGIRNWPTRHTCARICSGAILADGHRLPPEALDGGHHQRRQGDHGPDRAAERAAGAGERA